MSHIKGKDTAPEMFVRRLTFSLGYRYRIHYKKLHGKPDLVFPAKRKVIFVHGCFWHRHNCKYGQVLPKTNKEFWTKKLEKNKTRDKAIRRILKKEGWDVLVIWECQIKKANSKKNLDNLALKIKNFLN